MIKINYLASTFFIVSALVNAASEDAHPALGAGGAASVPAAAFAAHAIGAGAGGGGAAAAHAPAAAHYGFFEAKGARLGLIEDASVIALSERQEDTYISAIMDGHGNPHMARHVADAIRARSEEIMALGSDALNPVNGVPLCAELVRNILEEALPTFPFAGKPCGTTVMICLVFPTKIVTINIGDSYAAMIDGAGVISSADGESWDLAVHGHAINSPRLETFFHSVSPATDAALTCPVERRERAIIRAKYPDAIVRVHGHVVENRARMTNLEPTRGLDIGYGRCGISSPEIHRWPRLPGKFLLLSCDGIFSKMAFDKDRAARFLLNPVEYLAGAPLDNPVFALYARGGAIAHPRLMNVQANTELAYHDFFDAISEVILGCLKQGPEAGWDGDWIEAIDLARDGAKAAVSRSFAQYGTLVGASRDIQIATDLLGHLSTLFMSDDNVSIHLHALGGSAKMAAGQSAEEPDAKKRRTH